jgi:hypothetical protein
MDEEEEKIAEGNGDGSRMREFRGGKHGFLTAP